MENWEAQFQAKVTEVAAAEARLTGYEDPAHDLAHFERVVATAKLLGSEERAKMEVLLPAAWLHDLINVPTNDPRRGQASRLSGEAAVQFLREIEYPEAHHEDSRHAIEAH